MQLLFTVLYQCERNHLKQSGNYVQGKEDDINRFIFQDVQEDAELQAWINETATEGFGWQDGNTHDVPTKFYNVEKLVGK